MKMMAMNILNILRIVVDGLFEIFGPICGMNGRTELLVEFGSSPGAGTKIALADFSPSPEVRGNNFVQWIDVLE